MVLAMRVTVKDAAALLGCSEEFVRVALQQKMLPIGFAMRMDHSTRYTYYINSSDLAAYLKIPEEEVTKRRQPWKV